LEGTFKGLSVGEKGSNGDGKIHGWALHQGRQGASWSQGNLREEQRDPPAASSFHK